MPINFSNENNFLDLYLSEIKEKNSKLSLEDKNLMIKNIREISQKIYERIASSNEKKLSILMAGYIQSGKTNSFLGCIAKLMENYSNFSILLLGVQHELYSQNLERVKIFKNSIGLSSSFLIYDNDTKFDDYSFKMQIEKELKQEKRIIICILKNYQTINKVSSFLQNLDGLQNPIVVDDEGDQYSFTDIRKITSISDSEDYTATYKSIFTLLNTLDNYSYITVTATPYAHILVSNIYGKYYNYIKPDYGYVIKKGNNYLGLDFFLGGLDGMDIVKTIKDENEIDTLVKYNMPTQSLKESLTYFFVYGLIFYYETSLKRSSPEMLIHFNVGIKNNNELEENIKKYLEIFSKKILDKNSDEWKWMESAVKDYNNFILNNFENDDKIANIEDVSKKLSKLINENFVLVKAIIGNKTKNDEEQKIFKIFLGSKKIDRGNTFSNLIVSYVTKRSKKDVQADTLLQMCRWFGYREKYKHLIRVWFSSDLLSDYSSIYELEDNVMNILENCEKKSLKITDLPRLLDIKQWNSEKKIFGTRKSVDPQEYIYDSLKSWSYSTSFKNILIFQNSNKYMYQYFQNFIAKWKQDKKFLEKDLNLKRIGNFPYILYKENNYQNFVDDVGSDLKNNLSFILGETSDEQSKSEMKVISERILKDVESKLHSSKGIIVTYMCKNLNNPKEFSFEDESTVRTRKFSNGKIVILEKGQNNNYLGDKYWYKDYKDYIFLQIHRVKPIPENGEIINTNTPDGCIYKLLLVYDKFLQN